MYYSNRAWANGHTNELIDILKQQLPYLVSITQACEEKDTKYATDLVLTIKSGDIATRIRRNCIYRDFTIRSHSKYGNETEIDKLRKGFAKWYLYAWTDSSDKIDSWILIDLDKVRESGLLDIPRKDIPNHDGTYFKAIPIHELEEHNCIVNSYNINQK